jgi:hypothetical protein
MHEGESAHIRDEEGRKGGSEASDVEERGGVVLFAGLRLVLLTVTVVVGCKELAVVLSPSSSLVVLVGPCCPPHLPLSLSCTE